MTVIMLSWLFRRYFGCICSLKIAETSWGHTKVGHQSSKDPFGSAPIVRVNADEYLIAILWYNSLRGNNQNFQVYRKIMKCRVFILIIFKSPLITWNLVLQVYLYLHPVSAMKYWKGHWNLKNISVDGRIKLPGTATVGLAGASVKKKGGQDYPYTVGVNRFQ